MDQTESPAGKGSGKGFIVGSAILVVLNGLVAGAHSRGPGKTTAYIVGAFFGGAVVFALIGAVLYAAIRATRKTKSASLAAKIVFWILFVLLLLNAASLLPRAVNPRAASAQTLGAFTGEVKDSSTLAPLAAIRVYLLEKSEVAGQAVTDARGHFAIPHASAGIFQLRFDQTAMKSVYGPIDTVGADSVIDRKYNAAFQPILFDSVFYESQVDIPAALSPEFHEPPRYPASLQRSGMSGSVSLTFVVDTTGHVEMNSVKTIKSSDGAFFKAVMDALPRMVFNPARVSGKKVRQFVMQRFDFATPVR